MDMETNLTCTISEKQWQIYYNFSWWMDGILSLCISIAGGIFNSMTIYILCHNKMIPSFFNRLLICLAVVDTLFLGNAISDAFINQFGSNVYHQTLFVKVLYPARSMLMFCSIYITVSLSFERYKAISNPFLHRRRQNDKLSARLLLYILPVISFSLTYYIPKFFELQILENESPCESKFQNSTMNISCTPEFYVAPTAMRRNYSYILWYINVSNLVVTCIIPFSLLVYLNFRIWILLTWRFLYLAIAKFWR